MWPISQFPADLVTFTEETVNGKLHFLCSERDFYLHGILKTFRYKVNWLIWFSLEVKVQTMEAQIHKRKCN